MTVRTFERGRGVVTLGGEGDGRARVVPVEKSRLVGPINLVRLKLRPCLSYVFPYIPGACVPA